MALAGFLFHVRHVAGLKERNRLAILTERRIGLTAPCDDANMVFRELARQAYGTFVALLLG